MTSSPGDLDFTPDPHSLFEIKTEDPFEDEGLTASDAETKSFLPSYVHLEEPVKNRIEEEAVIKNESMEDGVVQGNDGVTASDFQMGENSLYDSTPSNEENSSSANDAETNSFLPSYVHPEEPGRNQIEEEAVIKSESMDDGVVQGSGEVTSCDFQMGENSLYGSSPFQEENSLSASDPRVRKCSVVLYRMSMQEILELREQGNHSKKDKRYNCELCLFKTAYPKSLERHEKVHTGARRFSCALCPFKTAHIKSLERHKNVHIGSVADLRTLICKWCPFKTAYPTSLLRHVKVHTGEKPFACTICNYKARQREHLLAHVRGVHKNRSDTYETRKQDDRCPPAVRQTTSLEGSSKQMGSRPSNYLPPRVSDLLNDKMYYCDVCDFETSVCRELVLHMKDRHAGVDLPLSCSICKFWAGDRSKLRAHMRKHKEMKKCEYCRYQTPYVPVMARHMSIHTGSRAFKCKQCDFTSSNSSNLYVHMRKHTGEKPYKCHLCGFRARYIQAMKTHIDKHNSGVESMSMMKCKICNFFPIIGRKELARHMIQHPGEEFYKCEDCDFCTYHKKSMKAHKWRHVGGRPFKCEVCDHTFSVSSKLRNHIIKAHSGKQTKPTAPDLEEEEQEDLIEANKRLMRSLELESPLLQSPQTSSAPANLKERSSGDDELHDTLLMRSEVQNGSEDESGASDADVMFL